MYLKYYHLLVKMQKRTARLRISYSYIYRHNLGDTAGSLPDHHKQVTQFFWFPSAYKGHVYATHPAVYSVQ